MQVHGKEYNVIEMMSGNGSEGVGGLPHEATRAAIILGSGIIAAIAYGQTIRSVETIPYDTRQGLVVIGAAGIGVLSAKIANPVRRIYGLGLRQKA